MCSYVLETKPRMHILHRDLYILAEDSTLPYDPISRLFFKVCKSRLEVELEVEYLKLEVEYMKYDFAIMLQRFLEM